MAKKTKSQIYFDLKKYAYDAREYSHYPEWLHVKEDYNRMTISFDDPDTGDRINCQAMPVVCPDCQGRGKYVNPSIDSHGLTAEDFAEDRDFEEEYMSGRYNITCRSCGGHRVILEPDPNTECGKKLQEALEYEMQSRMESEAERRMGA